MRQCRFYMGWRIEDTAKESEASPRWKDGSGTDETGHRSDPTENERRSGSDAGGERILLTAK